MTLFNNREIATGIWILVFLIGLLVKKLIGKDLRHSILNVFKCFFGAKILLPTFLMIAYTAGMTVVLSLVDLWNVSLLKDSIVWFCFNGFITMLNAVTSENDKQPFRKIIANNIKLVIIFEFVINTYTFSLVGELVLVPFATMIAAIAVFAQTKDEYLPGAKLMSGIQILIGIAVLTYAICHAVADYTNLGSFDTLRKFLLAPMLTIMFLPCVYLMLIYTAYDFLFMRLNVGREKGDNLKRYAKKRIVGYCLLSLKKLKIALNMNNYNVMLIGNEKDVDEMIEAWRHLQEA